MNLVFLRYFVVIMLSLWMSMATASDINRANQQELQSIKGIGKVLAAKIIAERQRSGPFLSWQDVAKRVHGLGAKSVERLRQQGLTLSQPLSRSSVNKRTS